VRVGGRVGRRGRCYLQLYAALFGASGRRPAAGKGARHSHGSASGDGSGRCIRGNRRRNKACRHGFGHHRPRVTLIQRTSLRRWQDRHTKPPPPTMIRPSAMSAMDELVDILTIEPIEVNLFRGRSPPADRIRIFGGQVVAQALTAAYKTVEGRICHSLQSYFIRPGDPKQPVLYQVERSRDGKSFATRRVIAIQKGEQIFNLACSFQVPEDGYDHADEMPPAPLPNEVPDENERWREMFKDQP